MQLRSLVLLHALFLSLSQLLILAHQHMCTGTNIYVCNMYTMHTELQNRLLQNIRGGKRGNFHGFQQNANVLPLKLFLLHLKLFLLLFSFILICAHSKICIAEALVGFKAANRKSFPYIMHIVDEPQKFSPLNVLSYIYIYGN